MPCPESHDKHVNENMSNMLQHVIIQWFKSVLKKKKKKAEKCHGPISHDEHVNESMSNMS